MLVPVQVGRLTHAMDPDPQVPLFQKLPIVIEALVQVLDETTE